jgi:hypothetical protein
VRYLTWTADELLRQTGYLGFREDKAERSSCESKSALAFTADEQATEPLASNCHVWTSGNRGLERSFHSAVIRALSPGISSMGGNLMPRFVGLDVSQKLTAI